VALSFRSGQRKLSHEGQDRTGNGSQQHNIVRLRLGGGVYHYNGIERDLVLSANSAPIVEISPKSSAADIFLSRLRLPIAALTRCIDIEGGLRSKTLSL
jgi:hypothetical protein